MLDCAHHVPLQGCLSRTGHQLCGGHDSSLVGKAHLETNVPDRKGSQRRSTRENYNLAWPPYGCSCLTGRPKRTLPVECFFLRALLGSERKPGEKESFAGLPFGNNWGHSPNLRHSQSKAPARMRPATCSPPPDERGVIHFPCTCENPCDALRDTLFTGLFTTVIHLHQQDPTEIDPGHTENC